MKTELKKSCSKCKYADWDADGCTCMIEQRLIGNAFAYVCDNFSSAKPFTNGDRIRQMTDEELAEFIVSHAKFASDVCRFYDKTRVSRITEWLKQEVAE